MTTNPLALDPNRALPLSGNSPRGVATAGTKELTPEKKKELESLKKACNDFESIFTYQLLKEMRKTVNRTGLIHGGQAEEVFSDMLDQERAKGVMLGLGDLLFTQLSKQITPSPRRR